MHANVLILSQYTIYKNYEYYYNSNGYILLIEGLDSSQIEKKYGCLLQDTFQATLLEKEITNYSKLILMYT